MSRKPTYEELEQRVKEFEKEATERRLAEEALRESVEKHRILLDEASDPIFSFYPDGQYRYVNRAFAVGVGKRVEEIIGKKIWDVFPKDEADKRFTALSEVFRTGEVKVIEVRVPRGDGDRYYLTTITPIKAGQDRVISAICSSKDITERRRAEQALIERGEQLREAQEIARLGRWELDLCTNRLRWSDGIFEIFEIDRERFGSSYEAFLDAIHPDDRSIVNNGYTESVKNRTPYEISHRLLMKDGRIKWVNEICRTDYDPQGRPVRSVGTVQDITELKRVEEEKESLQARLQRAQKMEAIGTLAGGVAHDLNNILSGIVSYPDLLIMQFPADSPMRKPLATIRDSGKRAAAIVQDLLTLARRAIPTAEVVNLNDVIAEYLKSPEHETLRSFHPDVQVETHLDADLLNTLGSPVHLSKTVMNLVSNAAEAMPQGGKVLVSTENRYVDSPIGGYDHVEEGDYVTLSVSDTGGGILSGDRERIFEPFYTKKVMGRSGTGLGMAVVWGTMKDHNGYIDVQSIEGKGTTFTLYFPVTREDLVKGKPTFSIEEYRGRGESTLVVDDVGVQREIASALLSHLGYSVSTVSSGEEAVEYMKHTAVDLVVLDMVMDQGIDGLETYRRILEMHPKQKAIIASGFSETERVKEAQRLGAGPYIRKPYTLEKIGIAVRRELDR